MNPFEKNSISLSLEKEDNAPQLFVSWPAYILHTGEFKLFNKSNKELASQSIGSSDSSPEQENLRHPLDIDWSDLKNEFAEGVHFCIKDNDSTTRVTLCSDKIKLEGGGFKPLRKSNKVRVRINGVKVPTNAQVTFSKEDRDFDFEVKFYSGAKIKVQDKVRHYTSDQFSIDPMTKSVFIRTLDSGMKKGRKTFLQRMSHFMEEHNYYIDKVKGLQKSSRVITENDFEFAPSSAGASLQIFSVALPQLPTSVISISTKEPLPEATYNLRISIPLKKPRVGTLSNCQGSPLVGADNKSDELVWSFHLPNNSQFAVHLTNFELMGRFSSGVRPLQRSFGAGLRYLQVSIDGEGSNFSSFDVNMLGAGIFWHTAPLRLMDDIVNLVPFFKYPKWMEISAYYYPMNFSDNINLGAAFSFHARGRLFFSQSWFFDAAINGTHVSFEKVNEVEGDLAFIEGTLGIGYNF